MRGLFRRVWKAVLTLGALFAVIATMPTQSALAQVEEMAPRAEGTAPTLSKASWIGLPANGTNLG